MAATSHQNEVRTEVAAPDLIGTPAAWYRGGTSDALFVLRQDLPITDPDQLDAWILAAFGSPDRREIDGVGGADLTTTKFAMLTPQPAQMPMWITRSSRLVSTDLSSGGTPTAATSRLLSDRSRSRRASLHRVMAR